MALPGTSRSGVGPVEFCSFTACDIPASSTPLACLTRQRASSVDSDFDDPDAEQPDADDLDDPEGPVPDLLGDPPLPTFGADADKTIPGGVMAQLAQAIASLAHSASRPQQPPTSALWTRVCEPEQFDGSDPHKLRVFLVQCELNYQDRPLAFHNDRARVIFAQSYLKGMVLDWFELDLLFEQNPLFHPLWMDNFQEFTNELHTNFGPTILSGMLKPNSSTSA